jgi:hypothetical protein
MNRAELGKEPLKLQKMSVAFWFLNFDKTFFRDIAVWLPVFIIKDNSLAYFSEGIGILWQISC